MVSPVLKVNLIQTYNQLKNTSLGDVFTIYANNARFVENGVAPEIIEVMSKDDTLNYIMNTYGDRYVFYDPTTQQGTGAHYLSELFKAYKKSMDFESALYELIAQKYRPIENYNRTETAFDGKTTEKKTIDSDAWTAAAAVSGNVTAESTQTETITREDSQGITILQPGGSATFPTEITSKSPKTEHYTTTNDDSTTGRLEYYDTPASGNDGKNSTDIFPSVSSTKQIGHGEEYTVTHEQLPEDKRELHAFGNIGVTTTQQMIESDLQLKFKTWVIDFIDSFILKHTFYSESIDFDYDLEE